jgi:F-type H+-transporting ATPase subunit epsilon
MAEQGFKLTVLTQQKAALDRTVRSIVAPGSEGYLGVLRNHAPLVTALVPGRLSVTGLGETEPTVYALAGGFLEVRRNVATVLADALEPADRIDVERAERAAERARRRLAERPEGIDVARAEAALSRALNRIRIARGR